MRLLYTFICLIMLCLVIPAQAFSPNEIAVAYNTSLDASRDVALYYAQEREIPSTNIIGIDTPKYERISGYQYIQYIATPIWNVLSQPSYSHIKVIVLCYGIPLTIHDTNTSFGSVDSALVFLGNDNVLNITHWGLGLANPYCNTSQSWDQFRDSPANLATMNQRPSLKMNYLVCRLDGFSTPTTTVNVNGQNHPIPLDVKNLIDRAKSADIKGRTAALAGKCVLDDATSSTREFSALENTLNTMGLDVDHVGSTSNSTNVYSMYKQNVMLYTSSGSYDYASHRQTTWWHPCNTWQDGAIGIFYKVSYDGASFRESKYSGNYLDTSHVEAGYLKVYLWSHYSDTPLDTSLYCNHRLVLYKSDGTILTSARFDGITTITNIDDEGKSTTETVPVARINLAEIAEIDSSYLTNAYWLIYFPDDDPIHPSETLSLPWDNKLPSGSADGITYRINMFQCLSSSLIREGCSAVTGNVEEPNSDCAEPYSIFPQYASGRTWAESAYKGFGALSWMQVAVGDPLMAPYATPPDIEINYPNTDGMTISGTAYSITASATPVNTTGINRVEFWLNDNNNINALIGTDYSAPYGITFNTTTLPSPYNQAIPNGRYLLKAVAYEDTDIRECGVISRPIVINNGGSPVTVSIDNPLYNGAVLSNVTNIAVTVNDTTPPTTAKVDIWLHGNLRDMLIGTISSSGTLSFNTTLVPDGDYSIQAVVYSTTGQASASTARQVYIDNSGLIQITYPITDGQTITGKFDVNAACAASVSRVDFWFAQGTCVGKLITSDIAYPFSCSIDSTKFFNGNYTIRAIAYTSDGSQAVNIATRKIVINNPQLLAFSLPASDGQTVSGLASVQVTAGATDPSIDHVDLCLINEDYTIRSSDTESPFNWSVDTTTLVNGVDTMRAVAYKTGGGQIVYTPTRTIIVDNPNLLSVEAPATDGTSVSDTTTIMIAAPITTPDIARVDIHFSGKNTSGQVWSATRSSDGFFKYEFDTNNYQDGYYTINVYAYKPNGKKVTNSFATRKFTINNNHPAYSISEARALNNSECCKLEAKVVSVGNNTTQSAMENAMYVEEPDHSAGIRVVWSYSTIPVGKQITILGTVSDFSRTGERQIVADDISIEQDATPIQPLSMDAKFVGGISPSSNTIAATDAVGAYNTGLLVRVWGRVIYAGSDFVYIDDGCGSRDGNNLQDPNIVPLEGGDLYNLDPNIIGIKGLRIYFGDIPKPGIDDYVAITGISSLETIGSNRVAMIRVRSSDDVTYIDQYIPAKIILGGIASVNGSTPLPAGTKVRLVDKQVLNILTWQGTTSVTIRETSGLHPAITIPTQLQPGNILPLSVGDTVTVTGVIMNGTAPPQNLWRVDPSAGHIYWGGSSFGAMSVSKSREQDNDGKVGGGLFIPWSGPSADEIFSSTSFLTHYNKLGNIGWILSQPDMTVVSLSSVTTCTTSNGDKEIGLREWFEPMHNDPNLTLVLTNPATFGLADKSIATLDIVNATLTTLPDGRRALVNPEAVYMHTNSDGFVTNPLPGVKEVYSDVNSILSWPWKTVIAP